MKQKQVALMLEVLDGIADGSSGITCAVSTDLWGINFDWGGEQSAYDAIEVRCNALGFSLAGIKEIMNKRPSSGTPRKSRTGTTRKPPS